MTRYCHIVGALLSCILAACGYADSPYYNAIRMDDLDRLKYLTTNGPPNLVNQDMKHGITPLHLAAILNHAEMVDYLLDHDADVKKRTKNGFTPLHWAASRDSLESAERLIAAGADVAATNSAGVTALHWASRNNATNMVTLLLAAGSDPESETRSGFTPLHWAIRDNSPASSDILALNKEALLMRAHPQRVASPDAPTMFIPRLPHIRREKPFSIPMPGNVLMEFIWIDALKSWVAKYEVSNDQYMIFEKNHRCEGPGDFDFLAPTHPAARVSWNHAQTFCSWLTANYGKILPADYAFRLPTTIEWKTFASCGDARRYPWGNRWPPKYGNYSDESTRAVLDDWRGIRKYKDGYPMTCPVEKSGRNDWGLYGVGGNVWEWCIDWHDTDQLYKARRGGGWYYDTKSLLELDAEGFDRPDGRYINNGFRVIAAPLL